MNDLTLGFTCNPVGQIVTNTRSNELYSWTEHVNVNRGYTASGLNQYTLTGTIVPTYDSKGNLTSAGPTYAYSSETLLKSASGGIALACDPMLRLYQTSGGSAGTIRFAYDGADLIAEYDGSNIMLRRCVHGPGTDEPVVGYEGAGTTDRRFLHADERGSVIAISNASAASIATKPMTNMASWRRQIWAGSSIPARSVPQVQHQRALTFENLEMLDHPSRGCRGAITVWSPRWNLVLHRPNPAPATNVEAIARAGPLTLR